MAAMDAVMLELDNPKTILFNLSGYGLLDLLGSYDNYFSGDIHNHDYSEDEVEKAKKYLPEV